jgi:hypothetical protein
MPAWRLLRDDLGEQPQGLGVGDGGKPLGVIHGVRTFLPIMLDQDSEAS